MCSNPAHIIYQSPLEWGVDSSYNIEVVVVKYGWIHFRISSLLQELTSPKIGHETRGKHQKLKMKSNHASENSMHWIVVLSMFLPPSMVWPLKCNIWIHGPRIFQWMDSGIIFSWQESFCFASSHGSYFIQTLGSQVRAQFIDIKKKNNPLFFLVRGRYLQDEVMIELLSFSGHVADTRSQWQPCEWESDEEC